MSDDIEGLVRGICIFYAVGMVLGIARIGIRTYIQRRPGIEEILMGVAMIFWTGDSMLSIVILRNGTNQMTPEERASITPEEQKRREIGSKALLTAWFCYITFIWGAKTCLLLFYRRLMQRVKQIKVIKLAAILLVVTYAAVVLNMFLVCRPFKKNWQVVPDPGHKCTDGYEYVWVIGIFNIVTDAVLIAIPLPVVVGLRISRAKKAMLVLLFGSGVFVIVATTLRIYFTIGGDIANLTFWCMIETTSAMLVVNAPGIVSIYSHATSRSSHDRDYELHGQSNSNGHRSATAPPSSIINGKYDGLTLTTCTRACDEQVDATVKIKQPQDYTGPGDSRECIVVDQPDHAAEKNMVIHQSVTYSVKTEYKTTPQAGVLGRTAHVNSDKAIYEDDGTSRQSSSRLSMDGADSSQGPPVSKTDSMHFEP